MDPAPDWSTRLRLRPVVPGDEPFLRALYASTREDELRLVNWTGAQREAFLQLQFTAQRRFYATEFPGASHDLVLRDGAPVGRWMVDRRPVSFLLVDVALRPEARNQGVGTWLLRWLQAEAAAAGRPVVLHVRRDNRALRWYLRLGFRAEGTLGISHRLRWEPAAPDGTVFPANPADP